MKHFKVSNVEKNKLSGKLPFVFLVKKTTPDFSPTRVAAKSRGLRIHIVRRSVGTKIVGVLFQNQGIHSTDFSLTHVKFGFY
jgi:hypothetical protein